jgi:hypothetical protein
MTARCPRCDAEVVRPGAFCDNCGTYLPPENRAGSAQQTSRVGTLTPQSETTQTMTLDPPEPSRMQPRPGRVGLLLKAAAGILVVGVAGAAALLLPLVPLSPDKSVADMLPASTAGYIAADLNPSATTRANLQSLEQAFTRQPSWSNVQRRYDSQTTGQPGRSGCYRNVTGGAAQQLKDLGHDTTLALIGTTGINLSSTTTASDSQDALKRQVVLLAPLSVNVPLVQRLVGTHFSLPQKATTYRGVAIYQQTVQPCQSVSSSFPDHFYAALYKGYIVGGLTPDPIERIIDTDLDHGAILGSDKQYQALMNQLPSNRLGSYYISDTALQNVGVTDAARSTGAGGIVADSSLNPVLRSSAGTVDLEPDGVKVTLATFNGGGVSTSSTPAGEAASILPGDVLGELSVQGVPDLVRKAVSQYENASTVQLSSHARSQLDQVVSDVTDGMKGEADLVLFRSPESMKFNSRSDYNFPLALMWPVTDDSAARQHLDDAVDTLGLSSDFSTSSALDGTEYRLATNTQGGYAVRNGWAILSLGVAPAIDSLSHVSNQTLATQPGYASAMPPKGNASSVWYVNTNDLRQDVEAAILPTQSAESVSNYNNNALPVLAPFRSIAGSTSQSKDGTAAVSTFKIRITASP